MMEWSMMEVMQCDGTGHEGCKGDLKVNKVIEFFTISPQYKNANVCVIKTKSWLNITRGFVLG